VGMGRMPLKSLHLVHVTCSDTFIFALLGLRNTSGIWYQYCNSLHCRRPAP
jgi:hypothetical protein